MAGSQLKQLKDSLRASGLSRTSAPKDASKRKKQLSSASSAHRKDKLAAIGNDFNKFDTREEKQKFEVVTRRGKVEEKKKGTPGKSRAAGTELRKKTLLPFLDQRSHTSTFLDHRFGEGSANLTPEEKALERFTAERTQRLSNKQKKAQFQLGDESDGEDDGLTHGGVKLGFGDEEELEHGGWGGLGDAVLNGAEGANREPLLRRRMAAVKGEQEEETDEPPRKRSKAEIMEEVMLKSKQHKYERQKIRSADDETRHELDAGLKELQFMLSGGGVIPRPPVASDGPSAAAKADSEKEDNEEEDDDDDDDEDDEDEDGSEMSSDEEGSTYSLNDEELEAALAASAKPGVDRELLRKLIGGKDGESSSEDEAPAPRKPIPGQSAPAFEVDADAPRPEAKVVEKDADPYDSYVRMLALEPRAHASDRMKTPLELAKDAADELREFEEKRLRRQRGEKDESDDEDEKKGKKKARKPEADDLEEDYLREEMGSEAGSDEEGLGAGLEGLAENSDEAEEEEEDDEEESGSEEDEDEDDEEEGSDDEMDVGDLDAPSDEEEEAALEGQEDLVATPTTSTVKKSRAWGGKELKAELPFTFPCPTTHTEFTTLLHSSGIKEEDTATVVKRIRVLYHPGLSEGNKGKLQVFTHVLLDHILHLSSRPAESTFATINSLLPHLLTLSHAYPLTTAPYYVTKLALMQKNFVRGLARGALDPAARTWPGPAELTLLRLVGMTWSTSDLSHPVAAAALLLITQYLAQARVRSLGDIAAGLFLCTLASQYETQSKRVVPESLNFLCNAFLLLVPTSLSAKNVPGAFPTPDLGQDHVKALKLRSTDSSLAPGKLAFIASLQGKKDDVQLKVDLVGATVELIKDAAEKYVSLEAFLELMRPAQIILKKAHVDKIPATLKERVAALLSSIERMLKLSTASRKPLLLQHHKPIPIASYIPKFDEGFNPNRHFDPDTERAEANKTRALYKKEKKGAIRELRKDNRFLAGEEAKRKKEADAVYAKKITKIMSGLQDERAEEKKHERAKEAGKKRDKARSSRR